MTESKASSIWSSTRFAQILCGREKKKKDDELSLSGLEMVRLFGKIFSGFLLAATGLLSFLVGLNGD